jgi:hypothetical protein
MKIFKLSLKLTVLAFAFVVLQGSPAPAQRTCPPFAVVCNIDNGGNLTVGTCGFRRGENCFTCYGSDGSVQASNPDCLAFQP